MKHVRFTLNVSHLFPKGSKEIARNPICKKLKADFKEIKKSKVCQTFTKQN